MDELWVAEGIKSLAREQRKQQTETVQGTKEKLCL